MENASELDETLEKSPLLSHKKHGSKKSLTDSKTNKEGQNFINDIFNVDINFNKVSVYPSVKSSSKRRKKLTKGQMLLNQRIEEKLGLLGKKKDESETEIEAPVQNQIDNEVVENYDKNDVKIEKINDEPEDDNYMHEIVGQCENPVHNVYFQKIHRCGSSNIQNILFRAGDKMNLSFALPSTWQIGGSKGFNKSYVSKHHKTRNEIYNMFAHHTIFDEKSVHEAMPLNTKYITILRDPTERTRSMIAFSGGFPEYLDRGSYKDSHDSWQHWLITQPQIAQLGPTIVNTELQELGLTRRVINYDPKGVDEYIKNISKLFNLVMILEQLDESLILLKELLCWTYEDVVAFHLSEMVEANQKLKPTSDSSNSAIRDSNYADNKLYSYFKDKLDLTIREYGIDKMKEEVKMLRKTRKIWEERCLTGNKIAGKRSEDGPLDILYNELNEEGKRDSKCLKMVLDEESFTNYLKTKQRDFIRKHNVFPEW